MDGLPRRRFLKGVGLLGASAVAPSVALAQDTDRVERNLIRAPWANPEVPVHYFFNEAEAAFVAAAVDRLIPPDDDWPGAAEAGVVKFIDLQLAGAYGNGAHMYLDGPWAQGVPEQGYQLPLTPAQVYRAGIAATERHVSNEFGGRSFAELDEGQQIELLQGIERARIDLEDVPGPVFFETLLANTVEGFFADPAYGGNRDMAGWRMIGFPGAYANYVYQVERHGMHFDREPMSMVEAVMQERG